MNLVTDNMNLVRHIYKKFSGNPEIKEDLIQEGFVGLIRAEKTFDPSFGTQFSTYAARIIENQMLMYIRKNKTKHSEVGSLDTVIDGTEGLTLVEMVGDENGEDPSKYADLKKALSKLSPKQQAVIEQIYMEGKKYVTVGEHYGITKQGVEKIHSGAIKRLRKIMGANNDSVKSL